MSSLGDLLRARRDALGLGRDAVAQLARKAAPSVDGLHKTAIERWENGTGAPDPGQLEAVSRALGLSPDERLGALRVAAGVDDTPADDAPRAQQAS